MAEDIRKRKQIPRGVPATTVDHFSAIPFARTTINDPNFEIVSMSRTVTDNGRGHTLTGKTWNSESTIQHLLCLSRGTISTSPTFPQPEPVRAEVRRFYTFGSDMNAHPDLLHGGVIATILDSSLGGAIGVVFRDSALNEIPMFTVQLNVTYKKPVRTPGTVMVRSWVERVQDAGRKVWARGEIVSEGGVVHALAEGMWLRAVKKGDGRL